MKIKQAFDAREAVEQLTSIALPYKTAKALYLLKKALEDECEIIRGMEMKLLRDTQGEIKENDGKITFPTPELAQQFVKERDALFAQDSTMEAEQVDLSAYRDKIELSVKTLIALDGLVDFGEEET